MIATFSTYSAESPSPLVLVDAGKARAVIVIPWQPNRAAQFAARELQTHIQKITGVTLDILDDHTNLPDGLIHLDVGESDLTRAHGLRMADLGPQEYVQKFFPNEIVLMGKDLDPDPWPISVGGKYLSTNGVFGRGWARNIAVLCVEHHGFSDEAGSVDVWIGASANGSLWKAGERNGTVQEVGTSVRRKVIEYRTQVGTVTNLLTAPMVTGDDWHLLTTTWSAAARQKQILIDGKVVATGPYQKTDCAGGQYLSIGGTAGEGGGPWSWQPIDEFRLSSIVRTYPDGAPHAPFTPDSDTKILIHFDQEQGPRVEGHYVDYAVPDGFQPVATCYAVYDFLEKYCGVRWYFPTDLGMVCLKQTTLVITGGKDLRRKPWLKSRGSTGNGGNNAEEWGGRMDNFLRNHASDSDAQLFAMRMRMGGWHINFNHSFYSYYDRFWRGAVKRPEFFAKGYGDRAEPPQLCYTSPELISHVVSEASNAFAGGQETFGVVPMDNSDQCKCTNCQALLATNKSTEFSSGNSSELIWNFTDQIARQLLKPFPGHYIGQLSYFDYFAMPKKIKLSPNIIAGPCMGLATCDSLDPAQNNEIRMYKEWVAEKKESGRLLSCWVYQCFPNETGGQHGFKNFPGFHAHTVQTYMRMLADDNIDGVFLCGTSAFIDGYLTLKMMDDASINADDVLNEFFPNFYGPAAVPMRKFYDAVESSYTQQKAGGSVTESYDRRGMKGLMESCGTWISEAKKLAQTDEQKQRVALFEQGVWNHMQAGYAQYLAPFGGHDPYPLNCVTKPTGRDAGKFGNGLKLGGVFGVWDHGFDDAKGSIDFWVKVGSGGTVVEINSWAPHTGHSIGRSSYKDPTSGEKKYDRFAYRTFVGGETNEIATKPMGDGWHHVLATWDAASHAKTLCVDGVLNATGPYQTTSCAKARRFAIGGGLDADKPNSAVSWGWGVIDELRLSNVVRKPSTVVAPFEGDKDTTLLLHFDEPEGQLPVDASGRNWGAAKTAP